MKKTIHNLKTAGLLAGLLLVNGTLSAETISYDRYAALYRQKPKGPSALGNVLKHFPVYPFEILKWPIDKTLFFIDDYHIPKKTEWIYNEFKNRGITPVLNLINPTRWTAGAQFDFVRMIHKKHVYPDLLVDGWVKRADGVIFDVGSQVGFERLRGSGLSITGLFDYEKRFNEHFYGIGPSASRGEGYVYGMETTTLQPRVSYQWNQAWLSDVHFGYRNININGGHDGGRGQIGDGIFNARDIKGIREDSIASLGTALTHDTRNQNENSTEGGRQQVAMTFHEGLHSSKARYMNYTMEWSQYISLGSKRRVLALHAYGEHNDEINDGNIPFHQLAKLGGYGVSPHRSQALRGYDFNRFTDESLTLINLEYRYTIWEYRIVKLDAVFFWDEGQVFEEFSHFQLKDFRESYGLGFRFSAANIPLLSVELAHGDEGTNFYVKSKAPF